MPTDETEPPSLPGSCPDCRTPLAPALRIDVETAFRAAKRPAAAECVVSCPRCRRVFVATLRPVGLRSARVLP